VAVGYVLWSPCSYRFRLTVEVDTPEGLRSGSSVIQISRWESGGLPDARKIGSVIRGEAIFIDLDHGKNLIAILGWGQVGEDEDKIVHLISAALAPQVRGDWKEECKLRGRGDLPSSYFPTLISFSDLKNPATAKVVNPADPAATFGLGYALRRITFETTSDAVTHGIEKKLPWWSLPGRPAGVAWRAWRASQNVGGSQEPERLFAKE
jgi:hypothetical protein